MKTTRANVYREFCKESGNPELKDGDDASLLMAVTRRLLLNIQLTPDDLKAKGLGEGMPREQIYGLLADSPQDKEKVRDFFETEIEDNDVLITLDEIQETRTLIARNTAIDRLEHCKQQGLTENPTGEMILNNPQLFGFRLGKDACTKKDLEDLGITPQMTKEEIFEQTVRWPLSGSPRSNRSLTIVADVRSLIKNPIIYLTVALNAETLYTVKQDIQ